MRPSYNCSQDELYTAGYLIANSLEEELAAFTALKAKYNAVFVAGLRTEIEAAEAIADKEQREAESQIMRIGLVERVDGEVQNALGRLRLYIRDAWENEAVRVVRMQEAGFGDYDEAMNFDWEKVKSIMNTGRTFVVTHSAVLSAGENMPAGFVAEFETMATEVNGEIDAYLNAKENVRQVTQEKVGANNVLFDKLMKICEDGQKIFRADAAKRVQFVWTSVLAVVTPTGAAGLRGTVKAFGTNVPIGGAVVWMQREGDVAVVFETDVNGRYYSGGLPAGAYKFKLNKEGFGEIEAEIELKTGVTSYRNWLMNAGGGNVIVREGTLVPGAIGNVDLNGVIDGEGEVQVRLEAMGAQMNYFASNTAGSGPVGGVISVMPGMPMDMSGEQFAMQTGLGQGGNNFMNVQHPGISPMTGGWKVTFTIG